MSWPMPATAQEAAEAEADDLHELCGGIRPRGYRRREALIAADRVAPGKKLRERLCAKSHYTSSL